MKLRKLTKQRNKRSVVDVKNWKKGIADQEGTKEPPNLQVAYLFDFIDG